MATRETKGKQTDIIHAASDLFLSFIRLEIKGSNYGHHLVNLRAPRSKMRSSTFLMLGVNVIDSIVSFIETEPEDYRMALFVLLN